MVAALQIDLGPFVDELRVDTLGNVIGTIRGSEASRADWMVFAHIDSLGMIVKSVTHDGFIRMKRVGGVPERVLAGAKVVIQTEMKAFVNGVIGLVAHHLTPPETKYLVKPIHDCYIDIGASSEGMVKMEGIEVGSPILYELGCTKDLGQILL